MSRRGFPSTLGAMGDAGPAGDAEGPGAHLPRARRRSAAWTRTSASSCSTPRASTPSILYTTVGLLWEAELEDPELSPGLHDARTTAGSASSAPAIATARADRPPVAVRSRSPRPASWSGPSARAPRAATSRRSPTTAEPLGHPDNDPVFAAAQDLGVPFAIHPTFEPQWTKGQRMGTWENVKQLRLLASVTGVRRRPPPVHDAVRLRRVRQVPAAEGARARVGRRVDRLLARPDRRRVRPHVHRRPRAARAQAERLLPGARAGSAAIPTSG